MEVYAVHPHPERGTHHGRTHPDNRTPPQPGRRVSAIDDVDHLRRRRPLYGGSTFDPDAAAGRPHLHCSSARCSSPARRHRGPGRRWRSILPAPARCRQRARLYSPCAPWRPVILVGVVAMPPVVARPGTTGIAGSRPTSPAGLHLLHDWTLPRRVPDQPGERRRPRTLLLAHAAGAALRPNARPRRVGAWLVMDLGMFGRTEVIPALRPFRVEISLVATFASGLRGLQVAGSLADRVRSGLGTRSTT